MTAKPASTRTTPGPSPQQTTGDEAQRTKFLDVIWNKARTPLKDFTKDFSRGGGFKGTAINPTYLARLATEIFGPNGAGWGVVITDEKYQPGAPLRIGNQIQGHEIIHVLRGKVWYVIDGNRYETSEQYGQTVFVGTNKYGPFTDEEAPKKSVTDLMGKCLSLLGFAADVHMGLWDSSKYVNAVQEIQRGAKIAPAAQPDDPPKDEAEAANENQKNGSTQAAAAADAKTAAGDGAAKPAAKTNAPSEKERETARSSAVDEEQLGKDLAQLDDPDEVAGMFPPDRDALKERLTVAYKHYWVTDKKRAGEIYAKIKSGFAKVPVQQKKAS